MGRFCDIPECATGGLHIIWVGIFILHANVCGSQDYILPNLKQPIIPHCLVYVCLCVCSRVHVM